MVRQKVNLKIPTPAREPRPGLPFLPVMQQFRLQPPGFIDTNFDFIIEIRVSVGNSSVASGIDLALRR